MNKSTFQMRSKRFSLAIVAVILIFAVLLLWRPWQNRQPLAYTIPELNSGRETRLVLVSEPPGTIEINFLPLSEVSGENALGKVSFSINTVSGEVTVRPTLLKDEFGSQLYAFEIIDRGVVKRIDEFRYSDEETVTVARGLDWFVQIVRR